MIFNKFWYLVGEEVRSMVFQFLNHDGMLNNLNATNVVLNPKVKKPK